MVFFFIFISQKNRGGKDFYLNRPPTDVAIEIEIEFYLIQLTVSM
jgi:hypothetical protein